MFEYLEDGRKFGFNYQELKQQYIIFCEMSDREFIDNLVDITHLAVFICFIKNIPSYVCLSDLGIVHELVHLMKEDGTTTSLSDIRELFKQQCELA